MSSTCLACPDGASPSWCGELAPIATSALTVTWCPGVAPMAAIALSCAASALGCNTTSLHLIAHEMMTRVVVPRGRAALAQVSRWLPPRGAGKWAGNINYGVQPQAEPSLDLPVAYVTTYSDVLSWMLLSLHHYSTRVRYLEIGVSVGKNLHQIHAHAVAHRSEATICGLDLEPFNPQLLPLHPQRDPVVAEWPTPATVAVESQTPTGNPDAPPSTRSYKTERTSAVTDHSDGVGAQSNARLYYVSADLKTDAAWDAVATQIPDAPGVGFDLIFSDAWHSAAAVQWELRQLLQRQLLTKRTVVVWDDLDTPSMQQAFGTMCLTLRKHHPAVGQHDGRGGRLDCFLSAIAPGWLASQTSNLIGIVGPVDVLEAAGLQYVLPSRLKLQSFGFDLPDA